MTTETIESPRVTGAEKASTPPPGQPRGEVSAERRQAYWRANLKLMVGLLCIWFVISYGFGILLVDPLNQIRIGGYKLGFWFAQQGSMYGFVAIIFYYSRRMAALDKQFDLEE